MLSCIRMICISWGRDHDKIEIARMHKISQYESKNCTPALNLCYWAPNSPIFWKRKPSHISDNTLQYTNIHLKCRFFIEIFICFVKYDLDCYLIIREYTFFLLPFRVVVGAETSLHAARKVNATNSAHRAHFSSLWIAKYKSWCFFSLFSSV